MSVSVQPSVGLPPRAPLTLIVCCYTEERWFDTLDAARSCLGQTHVPEEVIVVVDYNPDLLARLVVALPGCRVVPNALSRGISGARNTGVAEARTPLVGFLDDDATADPDWAAILADHCGEPGVLGAGGRSTPRWGGVRPRWLPEEFLWAVGCSYRGQPSGTEVVRNLMGGCMVVRRDVFDTVGGFHEALGRGDGRRLPISCEESELCIRANAGFPGQGFVYDPRAAIRHRVWAWRLTWTYFVRRCYAEGLSKAVLTLLPGSGSRRLDAEWAYVLRILPGGFAKGLGDALRGDVGGIGRAAAIFLGLAATCLGYLRGRASFRRLPIVGAGAAADAQVA